MNSCQKIICFSLIVILLLIITFSFCQMWKKDNQLINVTENYKESVKLSCDSLKEKINSILLNQVILEREYILAMLNNLSYDNQKSLYERYMKNSEQFTQYFKYILGDEAGSKLLPFLQTRMNLYATILSNYIKPTDLTNLDDYINSLKANSENMVKYIVDSFCQDKEDDEEVGKNNRISTSLNSTYKEQIQNNLDQLSYYYSNKFNESLDSFDKNLKLVPKLSLILYDMLCKKSNDNKE